VIWLHAVSVGEVFASVRLVSELEAALGGGWVVLVSTTTATGQKVAQERFGQGRVFYFPLDFGWIVRRYLRALKPELMILMESELWPRLLVECERAHVPVVVANARISDRSFPRYMRLRSLWKPLFAKVRVFLAQGEETAERLRAIGAERVSPVGNLKYDLQPVQRNKLVEMLRSQVGSRPVVVAGSTKPAKPQWEEEIVLLGMERVWSSAPDALLILAPRHPQRFAEVQSLLKDHGCTVLLATDLKAGQALISAPKAVLLLNTIGDLGAMYEIADVAFVGGSLSGDGGHNPLEAARFGVPVIMGPSYENFREIVEGMMTAEAIRIFGETEPDIGEPFLMLLGHHGAEMGQRGRLFFEAQAGATQRTVQALLELVR
jgi:3-deoxy-D-manno-octulosonic-acid transferase